ncbi:reticulocyte-binding protein 2 a-like protein [Colletotrichum incanum]|nr:reticulocyte-binding protein 2 a-like protein [Colletotrichum incanum]
MAGYSYDGSSSSAAPPPPPYSVTASASASASGSGNFGSTSSSLFAPPPTTAYAAHGESHAGPSSGFPSGSYPQSSPDYLGIVDSKWRLADPRSSSAHSLAPSIKDRDGVIRRTLLIIYIHGFYGNESSFRSFPAHVHNYLKEALAETHVVHSKIYPRYKTYKAIDVARDNFSHWLEPHESDSTDVILVGHSMGGLLAGEVAMMPNRHPYGRHPYKHRILGTISLDSPFLGLHPGIIVAGISSLFRPASPAEEKPDQFDASSNYLSPNNSALTSPNPSMYTLETNSSLGAELSPHASNSPSLSSNGPPQRPDPTFNPPFFNDLNLKDRPFMRRLGHFAKKHSREGIWDATKNHVMSHLEYGGCLADYPGLNARYNKLRAMESVDPLQHMGDGTNYGNNVNKPPPVRVRFVNYYTLSTGRPKKPKTPDSPKSPESPGSPEQRFVSGPPNTLEVDSQLSPPASLTPRISVEDSDDGKSMELLEPIPMEDVDERLSTLHEEQQARFDHESTEASNSTEALRRGLSHDAPEAKGKEKERLDGGADFYAPSTAEQSSAAAGKGEANEANPMGEVIDEPELPPIPDLPEQPTPPDLDKYTDKDARKQAEKEGKRAQKAYENAIKIRDKAIKERQKLVEKRRKKAEKEAQKEAQRIEKEQQRLQKEEQKRKQEEEAAKKKEAEEAQRQETQAEGEARRLAEEAQRMEREARRLRGEPPEPEKQPEAGSVAETEAHMAAAVIAGAAAAAPASVAAQANRPPATTASSTASVNTTRTGGGPAATSATRSKAAAQADPGKPKKERKFCTLPRKVNGRRDETWVPVYMEGMDEVGAHCGLFLAGSHYDGLIGDVGERILGWVQDDLSVRAIMEMP